MIILSFNNSKIALPNEHWGVGFDILIFLFLSFHLMMIMIFIISVINRCFLFLICLHEKFVQHHMNISRVFTEFWNWPSFVMLPFQTKSAPTWTVHAVSCINITRNHWHRPGWEMHVITLACSCTYQIQNTHVVCCTSRALYGLLSQLILFYFPH